MTPVEIAEDLIRRADAIDDAIIDRAIVAGVENAEATSMLYRQAARLIQESQDGLTNVEEVFYRDDVVRDQQYLVMRDYLRRIESKLNEVR